MIFGRDNKFAEEYVRIMAFHKKALRTWEHTEDLAAAKF